MKTITTIKEGINCNRNEIFEEFQKLDKFCKNKFNKLIEGVEKSTEFNSKYEYCHWNSDSDFDEFIEVKHHEKVIMMISCNGISKIGKYEVGLEEYNYDEDDEYQKADIQTITEKKLLKAVKIIQELIDFAENRISCSFSININSK